MKVWMIGAAVAAVSLFTVTAMASTSNTAGYDAFKEVLKASHMAEDTIDSATINGSFALSENGKMLLTVNGTAKVKEAGDAGMVNSDVTLNLLGVERSASVYGGVGNDTIYLVDRTHDLHYQVINADQEHHGKHKRQGERVYVGDRSMSKTEEALLDYMVGDLKNEFNVTEHADGSKTITVDVGRDEIPLPLRLLMDVAASEEHNERAQHHSESTEAWERLKQLPFFQGLEVGQLKEHLPVLTEDVVLERIQLQMTVDADNKLQGGQGELEISGKDEAGVSHLVKIEGEGTLSDLNATTPDAYDPSGKRIEIIDAASFDKRN